jgi:pectin methylesterase-like acyl-CoA thioesterase
MCIKGGRRGRVLLICLAGLTAGLAGAVRADSLKADAEVATDGSGGFKTLQAAIQAAPDNSTTPYIIHIKPGTYQGQIIVPPEKRNICFIGDGPDQTILSYGLNVTESNADTDLRFKGTGVIVLGDDFHAENLTFQNISGDHGQALALRVDGDRAVIKACRLLGWQDTLMLNNHRQYFTNCYIAGRVDFIYGSATAVFDHCELHSKNGGHVTAANTPQNQPFGFVFFNCRLTGDSQPWINAAGQPVNLPKGGGKALADLGRPWRPYASATYLNCEMGDHINPIGWNNWRNPANELTARFAEYHSTGPGANPDQRYKWAKQLTKEAADQITITAVLGGADHWVPAALTTNSVQVAPAATPAVTPTASTTDTSTAVPVVDIPLPQIPAGVFDITQFGASPDTALNSPAIQKAINAAEQAGGGTVLVPAGRFVSGPIQLQSNLRLRLAKGAELVMGGNLDDFPVMGNFRAGFITVVNAHDISIEGEGVIEGQGGPWWKAFRAKQLTARRPQMIAVADCQRVELNGFHTQDPPNTHCSLRACRDVTIENLTMIAPPDSPNTDALNLSGANILITNCDISTGDDNIVFLGSREGDAPGFKTENLTVTDCRLGHGHGLSIGSFTGGGVRHLRVDNVTFDGTTSGIRLKAGRGRGGVVEDLVYDHITMNNVPNPISITSYYPKTPAKPGDDSAQPVDAQTPVWKNILIENTTITNAGNAMTIWGLPECPVSRVKLQNVSIAAARGAKIINAKQVDLTGAQINCQQGPPLMVFNTEVEGIKGTPLEEPQQPGQ